MTSTVQAKEKKSKFIWSFSENRKKRREEGQDGKYINDGNDDNKRAIK